MFGNAEILLREMHQALRTLARTPLFSAVAITSLALGIGANSALFSVARTMLLEPLPVKDADRLVEFVSVSAYGKMNYVPWQAFAAVRQDTSVMADVFGVMDGNAILYIGGVAERVSINYASESFFANLGASPLVGRLPDSESAVVLSYAFWQRRFGRDSAVLGSRLVTYGRPMDVVGVMPPGFFGVDRSRIPDLWLPVSDAHNPGHIWVLGHLKRGVSIEQARAHLEPAFSRAVKAAGDDCRRLEVRRATTGEASLSWDVWEYSDTLKVLICLAALILLIACLNLAHLLMGRSAARVREFAIRLAAGATRWQLARRLLTENLALAIAGGALGLLFAAAAHRSLLVFFVGDQGPNALDFRFHPSLAIFGLALAVATALLFSVVPVLRATHTDLTLTMHGGARTPGRQRAAMLLLSVQVALSMVLLTGAVLFARSLRNLTAVELGFPKEGLLLLDVTPPNHAPADYLSRIVQRVSALAGARSAAFASDALFGSGGWNQQVCIERPGQPVQALRASFYYIDPGFFETAGVPVLLGREFTTQDRRGSPAVAVVNQTFAQRFLAGRDPLDRRLGDRPDRGSCAGYEIVGVVGDTNYGSVYEQRRPMVFYPLAQIQPNDTLVLHVRTAGPAGPMAAAIAREVRAVDPKMLVENIRTVPMIVGEQLRRDRMFGLLSVFFALVALGLGIIGIYGVAAQQAAQRTAEAGLRMALGATRGAVVWLILRRGMAVTAAGVVIGAFASLASGRLMMGLLYGVAPRDPLAIAFAAVCLGAAGVLAGLAPALRAASVDPMIALRVE